MEIAKNTPQAKIVSQMYKKEVKKRQNKECAAGEFFFNKTFGG